MKLTSTACAVLTLGPQMCRDKLIQAALRMRQLAKQQSLVLVATAEVRRLIWDCCGLCEDSPILAQHVLQWVHQNTINQIILVRSLLSSGFCWQCPHL
jgi:hypothetical protein